MRLSPRPSRRVVTICIFCLLAASLLGGALIQQLLTASPAHAAAPAGGGGSANPAERAPATVDRVVAIVNEEPIMKSEIDEQVVMFEATQQRPISDPEQLKELRGQVLQRLIDEKIILAHAGQQGIVVPDEQVKAQVDGALEEVRGKFPDETTFLGELRKQGMTVEALRAKYMDEIRRQLVAQKLVDREIRSKIKIQDSDVDTFYTNNRRELPKKQGSYRLAHILVRPKADNSRRAAARARAREAQNRLQAGDSWSMVLKKYSSDDVTMARDGDLGEVAWGQFDPDFEEGVRDVAAGKVSDIVETRFGFHLIQMVSRDSVKYRPRHILIEIKPLPSDEKAAIERAEKARAEAVKGVTPWQTLVNSYSDDKESKPNGGELGEVPFQALPRDYLDCLDSLQVGGISPVLKGTNDNSYHIFRVLGRTSGGDYKLEEIRQDLTEMLTRQKMSEEYDRWMGGLRKKAFVERKGEP